MTKVVWEKKHLPNEIAYSVFVEAHVNSVITNQTSLSLRG